MVSILKIAGENKGAMLNHNGDIHIESSKTHVAHENPESN